MKSVNAKRRIKPIASNRCIDGELSKIPDQNLLIFPTKANAHLFLGVKSILLLLQQIVTHRLVRMHDRGKSVIETGCFNKQLVINTYRKGSFIHHRKEQWSKQGACFTFFQDRNTCGITCNKGTVDIGQ